VLAGEAYGARSPLLHPSRPLLVDLELVAGARVELPAAAELGVFVISGAVHLGEETLATDQLGVCAPDDRPALVADVETRLLVLGGPPIGKRFIDWNFVASSQQRIDRARDAWKARELPDIPTDHDEFVPYPDQRR
jgi:redox-sensitive bicupin YhaK (pirin superfamily)